MRGRLNDGQSQNVRQGNTPAYAGKTAILSAIRTTRKKHPRVCGEDAQTQAPQIAIRETPPRMRGRPEQYRGRNRKIRNTPAYAGKTRRFLNVRCKKEKHPRVCGEDSPSSSCTPLALETPPRMRGRHSALCMSLTTGRNTPAYAGKTLLPLAERLAVGKHPRVCGEDFRGRVYAMGGKETPPRMRGRPGSRVVHGMRSRNTPAYAGKTDRAYSELSSGGKHPRVCGEDTWAAWSGAPDWETPPRMRGRLEIEETKQGYKGNTPAYAGKTATQS